VPAAVEIGLIDLGRLVATARPAARRAGRRATCNRAPDSFLALLVEAFAAHGLPVDAAGVRASGDKGTRANSLASTAGVGGVWLVAGAWNEPYLAELHAFPDGAHDDRVDASAGAFNAATEIDAAGGASVVNEPEGVVDERGTRGW
jgi:predicted phage terminase large subunit-like protein